MRHLSIIQHTQSEWLGPIEDHLEGRGIRFGYHRPFVAGGSLPNANVIGDGLIMVGGGALGAATDGATPPWLEAEVRLARACLMLGKPIIGFGLGAEVLSLAAEGRVEKAPLRLEVGEAMRTRTDALGGLLPETFPTVVYLRDRPVPPDYAVVLAQDRAGHPAVFQIGVNAFGFLAHPGLRRAMVEDLIMESEEVPENAAAALDQIGALGPRIEDALIGIMAGLVEACGWMRPPG